MSDKKYKPEKINIYDIFRLFNRQTVLVNKIARIEKHAVTGFIWEFTDRKTGEIFDYKQIDYEIED